jgi:UDPglucose 6-dehydrogenase
MKVSVFGSGYVGLTTAACLAESGNHVVCMDVDEDKVASLQRAEVSIYEPGLSALVRDNGAAGRLVFTTDPGQAVAHGEFLFIAVGTPSTKDGGADLEQVFTVAGDIGRLMEDHRLVIHKSTVPVGTADQVRSIIDRELEKRGRKISFDVISNPEFLKEGSAVKDFFKPDRIIIGTDNPESAERMRMLFAPFNRNHDRVLVMDVRSAELSKYAANAMLATRISFMNEMASIAERLGADIEQVRHGIGSDPRIGYAFLYAGAGYGGSCLPKDVRALEHTARSADYQPSLLNAVDAINEHQKRWLFERLTTHFEGRLRGRTIAVWGLAFKPNTNDLREAPSLTLIEALLDAGARVRAHDPEAIPEARRYFGEHDGLTFDGDAYAVLDGADALVLVTEWRSFWSPDFKAIRQALSEPVIFDGRNVYDPALLAREGFTHYAVGRGASSEHARARRPRSA